MAQSDDRDPALLARLRKLELMIFDVDGVLTDGRLHYSATGESMKVFHVLDGQGLKFLHSAGVATAIISGRSSSIVEQRASELGFDHVFQGIDDKGEALNQLLSRVGLPASVAGFMGDDWADVAAMRHVGFAATVPNAAYGVAQFAHWVSNRSGGRGAVREVCELILEAQGKLDAVLARYLG